MSSQDAAPRNLGTTDLSQRLQAVKLALVEIEKELARADGCPDGLEDFKEALDHIRLSAWAILTAAESHSYQHQAVLARFRMARGIELCENIIADLEAGAITPIAPEFDRFRTTLHETIATMGSLLRQYEHPPHLDSSS